MPIDLTTLPFNQLIGLERCAPESEFLVTLPGLPQYANHIGTVHAAALLAVAEGGSAEFLLQHFGDQPDFVPVVRRLESKFRKPARGRVSARATADSAALERCAADLASKGRALLSVAAEVVDEEGIVALTVVVDWFISRSEDQNNE